MYKNKNKKKKLNVIGKIIIVFFFQIFLLKLINSNQQINETTESKINHDKLLMNRQFKTIAIKIIDVKILFLSSLFFK